MAHDFFRGETVIVTPQAASGEFNGLNQPTLSGTPVEVPDVLIKFEPQDIEGGRTEVNVTLLFKEGVVILPGSIFTVRGTKFVQKKLQTRPQRTNLFGANSGFLQGIIRTAVEVEVLLPQKAA